MFDKPQNSENLIIPAHYEYYEVLIEDADNFIKYLESRYLQIHCDLPKVKYTKNFSNCLELVNGERNKILILSPGRCWVVPYIVTAIFCAKKPYINQIVFDANTSTIENHKILENPINILTKNIDKKITDILCNKKHETFNEESFKEFVNNLTEAEKQKAYKIIDELL